MAELTARFRLIDEMSSRLADMASGGQNAIEQWERAGEALDAAFESISSGSASAVSSVDGVAHSVENLQQQTDNWTEAVGNYDRGLLEAINTTEELVEQGFKTSDALADQERMFEVCERAAGELSQSIEAAADIHTDLASAMETAAEAAAGLSKSEDVSAESKAAFTKAGEDAAQAMNELTAAQEEAAAAMEEYDRVMTSGTTNLDELEAAAERAGTAAENLAASNGRATDATEELSKATEQAAEEADSGGKKAVNAVEGIAGALVAAGITAAIKEVTESTYELVTAFSEAESTVVKATGASGAALDGLTESMMNAYAASKSADLGNTASAIGEINTRMALTGDALTDVTGQFLDFSEITGTNVVGSVQSATKIMNKWNVDAENVGNVLDKLAYAGQVSGISVDALSNTITTSSATFQALDMSLDSTIGLLADLELYGTSSQTVVTGLRTAVNHFTKDGLDAGDALRDVIEEIANMEDASAATALAVETFGSRAGQELAGAIRSGAISVDSLTQSLDVANGTVAKTAETAQTLDQKWTQASNNINTAFTTAMQPAVDGISGGLAGIANGIGTFLNKHPAVTKAITAIGVGITVVVGGFALYTAGTAAATAATALFGTTLSVAIWPITAIAAGVAAVTAAVLFLVDAFQEDMGATEGMTAVTRAQYYELQDLNAEYERACEQYGETSEEALRLKYEVDDLSEAFEANRQTVEEFTAEVDALCDSVSQVSSRFNDGMTAIRNNEVGSLALIQKYEDLAFQTNLTAAQEKQLEAVNQQLAKSYPELAAQLDGATISTEDYVEAMRRACEQEAEEARQQQAQETYVEALQKRAELMDEIARAQENLNLEQARMDEMSGWEHFWTGGEWDDLEAYQAALDELNAAMAENDATIAQIEQGWADIADAEAAAADQTVTWQEAVSTAYGEVKARVDELCAAYDEAYQSALESFQGQFGLFDEAEASMDATVANAQAALDSQLAYWENYNANLETLTAYGEGLTGAAKDNYEALLAYVQDGSEEAAGLAGSIADAIASGDDQAIENLAQTISDVSAQQEAAAATTADWVTDFTSQMDEIEQEMQDTVEGMNLSDEAAASATSTITAYADQIRAGKSGAVDAANEVARAVSAALASSGTSVSVSAASGVPAHANGTTNAESAFIAGENGPELVARKAATYATGTTNSADYFIAGENGPELIIGEQGSTVFPTGETDRLIDALNTERKPLQVFTGGKEGDAPGGSSAGAEGSAEQSKHITLEIAGGAPIEVNGNGGASKEEIVEVLVANLRPALLNLVKDEIFEEGDDSYEH